MEDRQIIEKLTLLKSVTPRQDWVFSAKSWLMSQIGVDNLAEPRID